MITAIFPAGDRLSADTWEELEAKLAADPWLTVRPPETFRQMMMSLNWHPDLPPSKAILEGSSREFWQEMANRGFCKLIVEQGRETPPLPLDDRDVLGKASARPPASRS